MKVLFSDCTFTDETIEYLRREGIYVDKGKNVYPEEELANVLKSYDCYILNGEAKCTKEVIEQNRHLKLIAFMGSGYQQYVDVKTARKYGIPVTYTPGATAPTVAEFTIALMLNALKKIPATNESTKNGEWNRIETSDLRGKTVGIIGMGAIGKEVARLCSAFGTKIIYNSRTEKPEIDKAYDAHMVSLEDLFGSADIVSVNASLHPENEGMINADLFNKAKKGLILVNTARGKLINHDDLYKALEDGTVGFYATDVYPVEPIQPPYDKFLKLPNTKLISTPHNAYMSIDSTRRMEQMVIESLLDVKHPGDATIKYLVKD